MSKLKDAIAKLDEAVKDLTSLHVQTYSGTVNFNKDEAGTFDSIREELAKKGAATDVSVTLKLETLIKFDGDSYNFVASGDVPESLLKLHKDALDTGLNTRLGLMQMVKNVFD